MSSLAAPFVACLPPHRSVRPLLEPGDQRSTGQPKNGLRAVKGDN
jgi:hypothetical protein